MNKERVLVWRAQYLGDIDAFSNLVSLHQGKVRSFLARMLRDYEVADDIAQDSFLLAFKKIRSYKHSGSFSAWLISVATNRAKDYLKKERRRSDLHEYYVLESRSLALESQRYSNSSGTQLDLERAFLQLSPLQSVSITLNWNYGFSHGEIASMLDIPVGTVKTNISRGREVLRSSLGSYIENEVDSKEINNGPI